MLDKRKDKTILIPKEGKIVILCAVIMISIISIFIVKALIGKKGGNSSTNEEFFQSIQIDSLKVVQKNSKSFALTATLTKQQENLKDVRFWISSYDKFDSNAVEVKDYTVTGDDYYIKKEEMTDGDYYLYFEANGLKGVYPFTIPKMNPKIWMSDIIPTIEFEIDGSISWSSFIDNEGKHIYRSDNLKFDDSAQLLSGNMSVLESSYTDSAPSENKPYYFLVLTGKNNTYTYVTAPLFYNAFQENLQAEFKEQDGKAYLMLSGNLYATNKEAERKMELRVGNFDWENPASTFMVENTQSGDDTTKFLFQIPVEDLKAETNNLALMLTENGTTLEWSIQAKSLDLANISHVKDDYQYGLTNPDALQITKQSLAFDMVSALLKKNDLGMAVMQVTGTLKDTIGSGYLDYALVIKTEGESYIVENSALEGNGIDFTFDLDKLQAKDIWYDVDVLVKSTGQTFSIHYVDAVDDVTSLQIEEKLYVFREWEGILKISFELKRVLVDVSSKMEMIDNKPYLLVDGYSKGIASDDFYLAIRTGESMLEAENRAEEQGKFSFRFDLTQLKDRNTWYDILVGVRSDHSLTDVSIDSVSDMEQELNYEDLIYGFRDFEGDLKIQFQAATSIYKDVKAEVLLKSGKPMLRVSGTVRYLEPQKIHMTIRSGEYEQTENSISSKNGQFLFYYDMSKLPERGTWYDLVLGNEESAAVTDIKSKSADMEQSINYQDLTYGFRDFEGDLKIQFEAADSIYKNIKASIKLVNKKPILEITGTVRYVDKDAAHLILRSKDYSVKVENNSKKAGEFLFKYDLTKLPNKDIWYDLLISNTETGIMTDIKSTAANLENSAVYKYNKYQFAEYGGDLKVYYTSVDNVMKTASTYLKMINDVPYMVVEGTMEGAKLTDVYLAVRTGSTVIKVENASKKADTFLFRFDLKQLDKKGTWYDVLVGSKRTGNLTDLNSNTAKDFDQILEYGDLLYGFETYEQDLKIYYQDNDNKKDKYIEANQNNIWLSKENGRIYLNMKVREKDVKLSTKGTERKVWMDLNDDTNHLWSKSYYGSYTGEYYHIKADITDMPANGNYLGIKLHVKEFDGNYNLYSAIKVLANSDNIVMLNEASAQRIGDKVYQFRQRGNQIKIYLNYNN